MIELLELDSDASSDETKEKFKGDNKAGRPKSLVKRKQKLLRLSRLTMKRITIALHQIEKNQAKKLTESMTVELAMKLLEQTSIDDIIKLLPDIEKGL